MKTTWSSSWKASKQPRKQRKYVYNAPYHIKHKFLGSHVSKELKTKYNKRTVPVRKGDKIKVMRGTHKGKTGTVERVSVKKTMVYVTGIENTKKDGSKTLIPLKPSNLMITELNLNDKKREQKIKSGVKNEQKSS